MEIIKKNNLQVLTDVEIEFLENKYWFEVIADKILVHLHTSKKTTAHNYDNGFSIVTAVGKIRFTHYVIDLWLKHFKDNYSLFKIQNVVNSLIVLSQNPELEDIISLLNRKTTKIKIV